MTDCGRAPRKTWCRLRGGAGPEPVRETRMGPMGLMSPSQRTHKPHESHESHSSHPTPPNPIEAEDEDDMRGRWPICHLSFVICHLSFVPLAAYHRPDF